MQNRLNNLKEKVFNKSNEYNLLDSWHFLMIHYGWISFDEFKKIDAHLVNELVDRLNKMNQEQSKQTKGRKR